ncbi:putative Alpha-and gamma-adaptin-binding protein [Naja naja]|nr:putative Alpha-and gamma-adaptin-binding protein [Naja naja]
MAVPCTLITSCAAGFPGEELVKPCSEEASYPYLLLQVAGLDAVSQWLPLIEDWLPEVMILVCDRVSENGISRQKAQEWCIKHSFELVELNPEELPDEDDDFPESTGVKRIIQALNANVWSNVVMKNEASHNFGLFPALTGAGRRIGSDENEAPEANSLPAERAQSVLDSEEALVPAEGTQGDPTAGKSLFAKSGKVEKTEISVIKVAKAFWMAIRGDQDEIEGLSSDEDN